MKKFIVVLLVLILLVSNVDAGAFATIGMTGLQFVNPEAAQLVNKLICVSNPAACLKGKVVGKVTGELYQAIAEKNPEIARSIDTYNQVKGYIDTGARIINELELDDKGQVQKGTIEFKSEGGKIGNLVGEDIKEEEVTVSKQIIFDKKDGVSTLTFTGDGSNVKIKSDLYTNIKKRDDKTNAYVKLDDKGNLIEADITSDKNGGAYIFSDKLVRVPPDTRVTYKEGQIKVYGNGKDFELSQSLDIGLMGFNKMKIIAGDSVTIIGNKVIGKGFEGSGFKVYGLDGGYGSVTFSGGKIVGVDRGTDATIQGIEHKTFGSDVSLYYGEGFDPLQHRNENYFNYGKNKIYLGGSGFSSRVREGNSAFPDFKDSRIIEGEKLERRGILEFTPRGGVIEVAGMTKDEKLSFDIKSKGNFEIKNGRVVFLSKDGNLYASDNQVLDLVHDMDLNYNNKDYILEKSVLKTTEGKLIADYARPYEKVVKNSQRKLSREYQDLTSKKDNIEKEWGVKPRSFFGTIDDEREEDFLRYTYEAAEIASRNKFGVGVSPQEVMTNFMLEGGVVLFKDMDISHIRLDNLVDADATTFNYKGKEYKIMTGKYQKFIENFENDYGRVENVRFSFSIEELADKEKQFVEIKGKKYDLQKANLGESEHAYYYITTDDFSGYYIDHNLPVSGAYVLGTDVAGDSGEQKRLREGGFWPESLEVVTRGGFKQEQGTQTIPGDFNSLQEGLIGMSGILAERKKMFLDDFRERFSEGEFKRLSEEEISFWTYFYYNCGQGCGRGHLYGEEFVTGGKKRKGVGRENAFSKLSSEEPSCSSCPDPKVNALRRLATQEWLEQSGVFEVEPTTKKI